MRKIGVLALVFTFLFALIMPVTKVDAAKSFSDVSKDYWAAEQIYRFSDLGVIKGFDDGTFRPNNKITRAQAAIMLTRGLKLDTENVPSVNYKDISKDHYAYKEIAAVTHAGIMQGSNGAYQPDEPLIRSQMAIILANAFELKGYQTASFKDVPKNAHAYEQIDAIYASGITKGYEDRTFRPSIPTTRAQFAVFLGRAIDKDQSLAGLLKEVYANEQAIETYEYEGNLNLGISFPETMQEFPEMAMIASMLEDVKVRMVGAYQKDPMLMDMVVELTLSGDVQTTVKLPIVITEEKMWMKLPESPLFPLPEELTGKFIEFDLAELSELSGQPNNTVNLDLQTELALAINNLFFDQFAVDFYSTVENEDAIKVPSDVDVKKIVKFELTNDNLQPFVETLFNGFLPQLFELLQQDDYVEALGLTAEEIELLKEEIAHMPADLDEIIAEINKVVTIHKFEEHIVINEDDIIAYDVFDLDLDVNVEEETYGLKLFFDMKKSKINEEVKFSIGIPDKANTITLEELLQLEGVEMDALAVPYDLQ
ncbi:S-layer homology domain-containing protein [Sporosarcina sp. HYO08]|uniref:S-layer homology domain-containing protein n=1 Tax=Sporosarcina sp. HYO08 TaxID=1759557 RepID=UPI0007934ED0|nr:S-layer homology domain-containing protein [Sporosarcina sp. HYO08]KXH84037.1 hypothetical protein AU377_04595 [Sporosarcina sp. HYO08]